MSPWSKEGIDLGIRHVERWYHRAHVGRRVGISQVAVVVVVVVVVATVHTTQ